MTKKTISWLAVGLWMALIFYLSFQPATQSNQLSKGITEVILQAIEKMMPGVDVSLARVNHYLRKTAHFFAYFSLGILVINALRKNGYKRVRAALLICVLFAISDEAHQLFVPGRGGQLLDVFIDSAGASAGILIYCAKEKLDAKRAA